MQWIFRKYLWTKVMWSTARRFCKDTAAPGGYLRDSTSANMSNSFPQTDSWSDFVTFNSDHTSGAAKHQRPSRPKIGRHRKIWPVRTNLWRGKCPSPETPLNDAAARGRYSVLRRVSNAVVDIIGTTHYNIHRENAKRQSRPSPIWNNNIVHLIKRTIIKVFIAIVAFINRRQRV